MKDERVKEYFAPVRVLACEGVTGAREQCGACGEKPQASLYPAEHMLSAKGKGFVLFDFGREYHGGVRLITFLARGKVRIRFGNPLRKRVLRSGKRGRGTTTRSGIFRSNSSVFRIRNTGARGIGLCAWILKRTRTFP